MATNLIKGSVHTTQYANSSGATIASGTPVVMASTDAKKCRVGVALVDIADGSTGAVAISGCWRLPKVSDAVIAQGESVNWDASEGEVDDNAHTTAAGDVKEFGMADAAAAATTTTVDVWIDQPGTYDAA
jgi:predicted RecA/RadA family phage recombinase